MHKAVKTTHYEIASYWKNSGLKVREDGTLSADEGSSKFVVVGNLDEVRCMACGRKVTIHAQSTDPMKRWNSSPVKNRLQKCHIIPQSLGGTDEPDNLVCLCGMCHKLSPDTSNPATFWRWFFDRRDNTLDGMPHPVKVLTDMNDELERRGEPMLYEIFKKIYEHDGEAFFSSVFENYFKDYAMKHTCPHFGEGVKHSSLIACAVDWLEGYCKMFGIEI
jgi:hypothetical protein